MAIDSIVAEVRKGAKVWPSDLIMTWRHNRQRAGTAGGRHPENGFLSSQASGGAV